MSSFISIDSAGRLPSAALTNLFALRKLRPLRLPKILCYFSPLVSFCLKTTYFLVSYSSIFVISMGDKIVSLAVDVRCSMKYTCGKTCLKGGYIGMELPGLV
jgi:hypothetical protein